jgi:hypothetical protein
MFKNQWGYEVSAGFLPAGMVDTSRFTLYSVIQSAAGTVDLHSDGDLAGTGTFAVPSLIVRQSDILGRSLYGDCNYFKGQLSEVILYNRAVTDKEFLTIEAYLVQHWALTPSTTP